MIKKIFLSALVMLSPAVSQAFDDPIKAFQEDADVVRLQHLAYWTGLIERYHEVKGEYPFQSNAIEDRNINLVRILTPEQFEYFTPESKKYREDIDLNKGRFGERPAKELIDELEMVLGIEIDEKYDIQKVPYKNPIGYYYFVNKDGYLFWTTCVTCEVTPVSTKLMFGGYAPTLNVASPEMKEKVAKAQTRKEMLGSPYYKEWVSRELKKPEHVKSLIEANHNASER